MRGGDEVVTVAAVAPGLCVRVCVGGEQVCAGVTFMIRRVEVSECGGGGGVATSPYCGGGAGVGGQV